MNDPLKILGLANACNGQGNFSEAAKYYRQALSMIHASDDLRPGVMAALAGALQRIGETDEAESSYKEALAIMEEAHSKRALVLTALAALYTDLGKFAEAEPLYRQAMELDEQSAANPKVARTASYVNSLNQHANQSGLTAQMNNQPQQLPNWEQIVEVDSVQGLGLLRIELERALKNFAEGSGLPRNLPAAQTVDMLRSRDLITKPEQTVLKEIIEHINDPAHGNELDDKRIVEWITEVAPSVLASLQAKSKNNRSLP